MNCRKKTVQIGYAPRDVTLKDLQGVAEKQGLKAQKKGFVRVQSKLEGIGLSARQAAPGSAKTQGHAADLPMVTLELTLPKGVALLSLEYSFVKLLGSGSITFDPSPEGKAACFAQLNSRTDPQQIELPAGDRDVQLTITLRLRRNGQEDSLEANVVIPMIFGP
jgi:hypothetical protein